MISSITSTFRNNPSAATAAGIHRYDDRLEDYTPRRRRPADRSAAALRAPLRSRRPFGAVRARTRRSRAAAVRHPRQPADAARPSGHGRRIPISIPPASPPARSPSWSANFAPANERLRLLCAREKRMPAALRAARVNLRNPPRIFTEIAIEQLPGIVSFYQHDLPAAFAAADDAAVRREFAAVNARVIAALQDYQRWLTHVLLPRSHGGLSPRRRRPFAPSCATTRWWTRRSIGCSRSAWPTCATTRPNSRAWRTNSSRTRARSRFSRSWQPIIPSRPGCSTAFALPSTAWSASSPSIRS